MACPAAGASSTMRSAPLPLLELLDLAQDEDVLDARGSGGHHVDRPRAGQALGDPAHAVVLEVLEQGVVGGERAGRHVRRPVPAPTGDSTTWL